MRLFLVLLALTASGCADRRAVAEIHRGIIDNTFPAATLEDWKSLADHVAVVTVVDEKRVPGAFTRHVWLQVERVLWSAPHAPQLPPVAVTRTWGWTEDGTPLKEDGAARLTMHRSYVIPLVRYDEDRGAPVGWGPLADLAIMPLRDGRIDTRGILEGQARDRLQGATVDEARAIVVAAPAHPLARRFSRLRPRRRMEKMFRG